MADRAHWTEKDTTTFVDLCLEQVRLGKRVSGHLKQATLTGIGKRILKMRGKSFTPRQLRNKWDTLRKQWDKWNWLVCYASSGVGWNEATETFAGDDDWWMEAEETFCCTKTSSILCFREERLRNKDKCDELFQGTKGTNRRLWTPASSAQPLEDSSSHESKVGSGDSDGDPRFVDPLINSRPFQNSNKDVCTLPPVMGEGDASSERKTPSTSVGKRAGKRRYSKKDLTEDLGNLIATLNAKSSSSSKSIETGTNPLGMKEVMQQLWSLPVVVEDEQFGLDATSVLMDDKLRYTFMALPNDRVKTSFLMRHVEKYRKVNQP